MVQYQEIKRQNQDKVLFFRLGDFYEMFDEDAVEVSRLLNLTLTHRAGRHMCGIPFHAAKSYIRRLLDLGKKIAICEQLELTNDPRKLAKREVIQIVTPATVVDDDFLDARSSSYVLAVILTGRRYSVSYADITSGEFVMTSVNADEGMTSLLSLLSQVRPREVLVNEDEYFTNEEFQARIDGTKAMVTKLPAWSFAKKQAFEKLTSHVGTANLKAFGFNADDPAILSGGALLGYLEDTAKASLKQITGYRNYDGGDALLIDESSQRNLEIVTNNQDGSERYTLFSAVDRTVTSGGTRLLKEWLSFPLADTASIMRRQDWVTFYVEHKDERDFVRDTLKQALDLQRLTTRVAMHRSLPQDLVGIQRTVSCFLSLMARDGGRYQDLLDPSVDQAALERLVAVMAEIAKGINEQTQGAFAEGEVIQSGYDAELDELRKAKGGGRELLDDYLAKIREETGITTMKLASNKIIGHYLEVSKGQVDKVPSTFYRKQTLVNAERFTTDELIKLESDILKSGFAAEAREKEVYESILKDTADEGPVLALIARFLSRIDVLSALALTAVKEHFHKPQFVEDDRLSITDGRHPVVEAQLPVGTFVPNSLEIGKGQGRFCLITGPNMAGKSTFLRQCALIVLLAQTGSWVPAEGLVMKPVDRLFCRVGASDNLARGESTFMVEMQEAALILRTATRRSLVIIDELGRGTSSQDGMAIAWAVMQQLVAMESKSLFATHYHELAELAPANVQKLTLKVAEDKGTVVFLRKVIPGVAESSYGLNVAKLAGVPYQVIRSAQDFQRHHDNEYLLAQTQPSLFAPAEPSQEVKADLQKYDQIRDALDHYDADHSTPMDAMNLVYTLKKVLQK